MTTDFPIAVIGAGPVGLFAVFQAGMLGMRAVVIDALEAPGGQCVALYPEKPIYDIPAQPSITGGGLIDNLLRQVEPFAPEFRLGQSVESLEPVPAGWRLVTSTGAAVTAGAVVIAAGVGAFGPKRPPLAGIEAFEGQSVFYCVSRRAEFAGKRVVIAGGGDSAVDWALSLSEIAASVMVVHRRPKFRAAPDSLTKMQALAAEGRIELVVPYQLHGLEGQGGRLEAVEVIGDDGAIRRLGADILLPFFGLSQNLGPIRDWGIGVSAEGIAVRQQDCATGRPGIYAVGDIAAYPGKLKLILTGFAEAAAAVHAARRHLHPDEAMHFTHSTSKGVPVLAA